MYTITYSSLACSYECSQAVFKDTGNVVATKFIYFYFLPYYLWVPPLVGSTPLIDDIDVPPAAEHSCELPCMLQQFVFS